MDTTHYHLSALVIGMFLEGVIRLRLYEAPHILEGLSRLRQYRAPHISEASTLICGYISSSLK